MDSKKTELETVLKALLPLRVLVITLEALSESKPAFFHQAALMAFLHFLAKSPDNFDHYIRLDAPESGRIHYLAGDCYRFTLIGLAGSDPLLDTLLQGLAGLPHAAPKTGTNFLFVTTGVYTAFRMLSPKPLSNGSRKQASIAGRNCKRRLTSGARNWHSHGAGLPPSVC